MNIKDVLNPYGCVVYVVSYITSEKFMGELDAISTAIPVKPFNPPWGEEAYQLLSLPMKKLTCL